MRNIKDLIGSISGAAGAAHSYIVEAPSKAARGEFITKLISGLECLADSVEERPCGCCEACVQVAAGTSPDVVYMQMSGKSGYRTDDAAAFMERLAMRPYGRHLAGVIDDAGLMSETVQNKLLKTIEEPAPGTILLIAASRSEALLPTVRSRCITIRAAEYEEYSGTEDAAAPDDFMEGVFMLLTGRSAFHEFREFADRHIKSRDDALMLISLAEDKLRSAMTSGKAMAYCADRIEAAEKTAADIARGMDKTGALKRLYLSYRDITARGA